MIGVLNITIGGPPPDAAAALGSTRELRLLASGALATNAMPLHHLVEVRVGLQRLLDSVDAELQRLIDHRPGRRPAGAVAPPGQ